MTEEGGVNSYTSFPATTGNPGLHGSPIRSGTTEEGGGSHPSGTTEEGGSNSHPSGMTQEGGGSSYLSFPATTNGMDAPT